MRKFVEFLIYAELIRAKNIKLKFYAFFFFVSKLIYGGEFVKFLIFIGLFKRF